MLGVDTNVLVRMIVADDPRQAIAARNFIQEHCSADRPGYVSNIVLAELTWTLSRTYRYSRDQIAGAIDQILETVQLQVESSTDVAAAVQQYRTSAVEFADCLIGQSNRTADCAHTVTFDRRAAKLPEFRLLDA